MSLDMSGEEVVLIRVEGMHCHKCEVSLQRALGHLNGVREVEIDFNSKLASVVLDKQGASLDELVRAVTDAGYQVEGLTRAGSKDSQRQPQLIHTNCRGE